MYVMEDISYYFQERGELFLSSALVMRYIFKVCKTSNVLS